MVTLIVSIRVVKAMHSFVMVMPHWETEIPLSSVPGAKLRTSNFARLPEGRREEVLRTYWDEEACWQVFSLESLDRGALCSSKKWYQVEKETDMRILAISGSLRASSTNTALVRAVVELAPDYMECLIYNGLADLPHFSPEIDDENSPTSVLSLREQLQAADGVFICTPEYAFGVPGSLKNALDWTVSSGDFWGKPVAVVSASSSPSGGDKAHAALLLTLTALGARVPEQARLMIPAVTKKLNAKREVSDAETKQALARVLDALALAIKA